MATHIVRTPEPGVNDTVGAVSFVGGVAEVDEDKHAAELRYFRAAGYGVEELTPADTADVDGDGGAEPLPRRNASVETWRAFAAAHGMAAEEASSMSRDELVAHYTKETGQ